MGRNEKVKLFLKYMKTDGIWRLLMWFTVAFLLTGGIPFISDCVIKVFGL